MPSDFDLRYRFKNLPDDHLITALTTEAYKYSEQAKVIIRKILQDRDVALDDLPFPTLKPPAHSASNHEPEDQGIFSINSINSAEDFRERAEIIFKHRNLDPESEEEKKRFGLDKEASLDVKKVRSIIIVSLVGLYLILRFIYHLAYG